MDTTNSDNSERNLSSGIVQIYNKFVSEHYDRDPFQIYQDSRSTALLQIQEHLPHESLKILDLGAGTGELLIELNSLLPHSQLFGIDLSEGMLATARKKLSERNIERVTLYHGDAHRLSEHVPPQSMELVTMHHVLNHIDHATTLGEVLGVLRHGGHLSIATMTAESLPSLYQLATNIWSEEIVQKEMNVPKNIDSLRDLAAGFGCEVVVHQTLEKEIVFATFDELTDFVFRSGWCTSSYAFQMTPEEIMNTYRGLAENFFPLKDRVNSLVLLLKKA